MKLAHVSKIVALMLGGVLLAAQGAQAAGGTVNPAKTNPVPCASKLISAHEGNTAHTDGDTVLSQVDAYRIGASLADSDLWVTKDGYLVQMHDDDVSHSTNGTGLVTQMTLDQVEALRTRYHNQPIPTLDDSLAIPTASKPGRYLMFETKFSFENHAYLQELADEVTAAGMTDHVVIYSVYQDQLTYLKQIDPGLTVWFKATSVPPIDQVQGDSGVMLPLSEMTQANVAAFQAAGLTVIRERQVESLDAWNTFLATGANGLMTDQPALMIKWCRALG